MDSSSLGALKDIGFKGLVTQIVDLINFAIPVLIGFALLFFFIGVIRYIYKAGTNKHHELEAIWWGLIALFVLVSLWGIIRLFTGVLFPGGF